MTIGMPFPLTAIAWSPMRSGLLAAIRKESRILQLYDIQHASVGRIASFSLMTFRLHNHRDTLMMYLFFLTSSQHD